MNHAYTTIRSPLPIVWFVNNRSGKRQTHVSPYCSTGGWRKRVV